MHALPFFVLLLFITIICTSFLTGTGFAASGGSATSTDTVNYTKGGAGGVNTDAAAARGKETILLPKGKPMEVVAARLILSLVKV